MINHHEFLQIFWSNSEGSFKVLGITLFPYVFYMGDFADFTNFHVLFSQNRRSVPKNPEKFEKPQLKLKNNYEFF